MPRDDDQSLGGEQTFSGKVVPAARTATEEAT